MMSDVSHEEAITLFRQVHIAKQEWEQAIDTIGDVVLLVDGDNRITRCNKSLVALAGYDFSGLLGKEWEVLLGELGLSAQEGEDGAEAFHAASNRIFSVRRYPLDLGGKGKEGWIITLHDITHHRLLAAELAQKNEEIEQNRHRLQEALERLSLMIRQVARDGEPRRVGDQLANTPGERPSCWQIMSCQQSQCPCYGQEPMRCWHMLGTRCAGEESAGFTSKIDACEQCTFYQQVVRDPITRVEEEFNHMMFLLAEKSSSLAAAYTELQGSQAKLLQQEKMASIGQLAAGVAHEINNPMGFITSNLGSLAKYVSRLAEFLDSLTAATTDTLAPQATAALAQQRQALKIDAILEDLPTLIAESLDGAERVRTIVQNLKSFSRVDQAREELVDLNRCLEETINIIWNELKYKCTVIRQYGELPLTRCFPQQLNQVFMNLLMNAAHAIAEQGKITITSRTEAEEIRIAISDTGCGIPPENLSRLFEPFFTTKEVGKGTGLGLAISYDIVKKHGGRIEVESTSGQGTTFTVCLPLRN